VSIVFVILADRTPNVPLVSGALEQTLLEMKKLVNRERQLRFVDGGAGLGRDRHGVISRGRAGRGRAA
jgi:hypothetical protein